MLLYVHPSLYVVISFMGKTSFGKPSVLFSMFSKLKLKQVSHKYDNVLIALGSVIANRNSVNKSLK